MVEKKIIIDNNVYLKRFFEHNKKYEEYIKSRIYNNTLELINNNPHKIKTVRGYKYKNKTIYEYKISLEPGLDCRVAYIFEGEEIRVFFISNIIKKNEFTKLVSKIKAVKKA
ncbi:TPA: hypothetical protein ACOTG0_002954 [Clostridium perfringens]